MRKSVAVLIAIASLAVTTQASARRPTGISLVECQLGRINFETQRPEGPTHRFVLLLGAPQGRRHTMAGPEQVQVFDPSNLLVGLPLESASYSEDPDMLLAQTDSELPVYFRLAVALSSSTGALGRNGEGSAEEHMAQSYMGPCTISEPADAAAQFEALRAGQ